MPKVHLFAFLKWDAGKENTAMNISTLGLNPVSSFSRTGEFAHLLKHHYKDKIELTAVDPKGQDQPGVNVVREKFLEWNSEGQYDVVLFTKSLHHCDSLEKVKGKKHLGARHTQASQPFFFFLLDRRFNRRMTIWCLADFYWPKNFNPKTWMIRQCSGFLIDLTC
jgi:hypothetical protein